VRRTVLLAILLALSACSTKVMTPTLSPMEPRTPTFAPSPTPGQPTASATEQAPSQSPSAEWRLVSEGSNLRLEWSPGIRHLLVSDERNWPDPASSLHVVTASGDVITSIDDAAHGLWIDANRFFAYRRSTLPEVRSLGMARAFLGSLSSGEVVELEAPFGDTLSNGLGAVALAGFREPVGDIEQLEYVVWSGDDISEPRPGYSVAWSLLGDMMAVLHPITRTRGIDGWLEVVSWPELEPVFEDESRTVIGEVWFDPAGEYVAFPTFTDEHPIEYFIHVVDLASSEVVQIPIDGHTGFQWNAASEIVALSARNSIDRYFPAGELIASEPVEAFTIIKSSADGSTLVLYEGEETVTLAVGQVGALANFPLPDGVFVGDIRVRLSPDGDHLAIVTQLEAQIGSSREQLYILEVGTN
jgi:hypothetical protein